MTDSTPAKHVLHLKAVRDELNERQSALSTLLQDRVVLLAVVRQFAELYEALPADWQERADQERHSTKSVAVAIIGNKLLTLEMLRAAHRAFQTRDEQISTYPRTQ